MAGCDLDACGHVPHAKGQNEMAREFKVGDFITLEDLYTSERLVCSIHSRDGERATLKTRQGKTILARIRRVKTPYAECLDATGYNAVFSHDELKETGDCWEWRTGRPRALKDGDIDRVRLAIMDSDTVSEAAGRLDISKTTLREYAKKHGLALPVHRHRGGGRRTFKEADIDRVQKALHQCVSIGEASSALGCSVPVLGRFARKHDLDIPCGRKGKLNGEDVPKIKLMLDDGMTLKTIAIQLGVKRNTLVKFIKRHNVRNYGENSD